MKSKNNHILFLFLFVSLLVMNGMVNIPIVHLIGKWGKVLIAFLGIVKLSTSPGLYSYFVKKNKWIILFWCICIIFTFLRIFTSGFDVKLLQNNILFIFFIYFYYLLFISFQKKHKNPDYIFFSRFAFIMNVNFVFWTIIAILIRIPLWETVEGRVGLGLFYESYVALGTFCSVAAIANLTVLKYKQKKKKLINIFMFMLMSIMVFLSNSRNSELVLLIVVVLSIFPYFKKITTKNIYLLVLLLVFPVLYFFSEKILLNPDIVEFTTGRSTIWSYVIAHYQGNSILLGEGIFGLNETILNSYVDTNYYFQNLEVLYFHSSYLEAFAASGIIGFIIFMTFLVQTIKEKRKYFLINIIISLLIGGLFESFIIQPTILSSFMFWYLIIGPINIRITKHSSSKVLLNTS